jgi:hypothetical protein
MRCTAIWLAWAALTLTCSPAEPSPAALVVVEGDVVSFHMMCTDMDGNVRAAAANVSIRVAAAAAAAAAY